MIELKLTKEQLNTIINSLENTSYKGNNLEQLTLLKDLYAIREEINEI